MLSIHDHNTSHKRKAAVHRQGTVVYQMETVVTEATAYVGHFYWRSSLKRDLFLPPLIHTVTSSAYIPFRFYDVNLDSFKMEYHGLKIQLCS